MNNDAYDPTEPDLFLFNAIFGEQIRQSGDAQSEIEAGSEEEATYNRQKAYWENRKAQRETEAEDASVLVRSELEPALQAIIADEDLSNKQQAFVNAIEQHSHWRYCLTEMEQPKTRKTVRVPSWLFDLQKQLTGQKISEIVVNEQCQVGEIVEHDGRRFLVTSCDHLSGRDVADAEDGFDVFLNSGWNSVMFSLNEKVMTVLSERYKANEAHFIAYDSVKFPDEQYAHNIRQLRYSEEIGLYDRTWTK